MPRIFVESDDGTARVEVIAIADPACPDDDDEDPFHAAQCRTGTCRWNSFVDGRQFDLTEADAINEAEMHLDRHEHATA